MNDTSKKRSCSPPKAAAAASGVNGNDDDSNNSNAVELTLNEELNKINSSCEDSITVPAAKNLTRGRKATTSHLPAGVSSSQGIKENDDDNNNGNSKIINPDLEALSELVSSLKTGEITTTNNNRASNISSAKSSPNHNGSGGRVDDDGDDVANRGLRLLDSMVAVKGGHKLGTDFHVVDETLQKMAAANDSISSEEDYEMSSSSEGQDDVNIDAHHANTEVKMDEIVNEDVDTSDSGSTVARTHSSGDGQEHQQLGDLENGIRKEGDLDKDNSDDDAKSPYREIPEPLYNSPSPYRKHASDGGNDNKKVHSTTNTSSPPPRQLPSTPPATTPQTDSPNSYSQQRSPTHPSGDFQPQSSSTSLSTATHTAASIMSHEVLLHMPIMSLPNFRPATGCTNTSDYIVRCFVVRLRTGIRVVKHGRSRWCKSRLRLLHLHSDGRSLSWKPAQGEPARSSKRRAPKLDLSTCMEVRHAWTPDPLNRMFTGTLILRQKCETANAFKSFALIFPKRTVDITAVTADQCKVLVEGFSALCFRLQVALGGEVGNTSNGNEDGTPEGSDRNDDDSDDSK